MPFLIGVVLALAVGWLTSAAGLARDRALYPVVTIVIAAYYVLFAVMGGSTPALVAETVAAAGFIAAAVAGFRSSLWVVAAALAVHGLFDLGHGSLIANPGVPAWWPAFCLAYDGTAAGYLAWLLKSERVRARA